MENAALTPRQRRVLVALMHQSDARLALDGLLGPAGPEIGCDECFEQLDRYVDLELEGRDADAALPGLRTHLDGCPACGEEHESLRALVGDLSEPSWI